MATSLYPELADDQFTEDDWKELIDDAKPGGEDVFGLGRAEATLVGLIPARKRRSARPFILGFAEANPDTFKLRRDLPARHPEYPDMWATGVSFQPINPRGNDENEDNAPYRDAFSADFIDRHANYEWAFCTIVFSSLPYDVLDDGFVDDVLEGDESQRFVTRPERTQPSLQLLQAETESYLTFREGAENAPSGKKVPGAIAEYMAHTVYTLAWHMVPADYVMDGLIPRKILATVGRGNAAEWLGFPPGTLLMEAPEFEKLQFPAAGLTGLEPIFFYTVRLNFKHFDPEKGVPESEYRGHNLMPFSVDGKWYYATRGASISDPAYLPTTDFSIVFDHVLKPEA